MTVARYAEAAQEFDEKEDRADGIHVVNSLCDGLNTLRRALFERVHDDVERSFGTDGLLAPISESKSEAAAKSEIEVYQVAVSADEVQRRHYVRAQDPWYADWLARLRLGETFHDTKLRERLSDYARLSAKARRLAFSDVLVSVFPEAGRAPLILYRVYPIAARICTAVAFGDQGAASQLRGGQISLLPAIADCNKCRGEVLANEEVCNVCGNPIWTYAWLNAAD